MSHLSDLINQLCPDGVEYKPLWSVTIWDKKFNAVDNYKQPKTISYHYYLASEIKKLAVRDGDVKLLSTGGEDYGYTTDSIAGNNLSTGEIVCIPWGGKAFVQYYKGKFLTSDNRIATSADTSILNNKYLYYFLLNNIDMLDSFYRGSGIKHPSMKIVLDISIPIPPLSIQQEIVSILDKFTSLQSLLYEELNLRQKQYSYYRNKLLTFDPNDETVEWKKVSDITKSIVPPMKLVKKQWLSEGIYPIIDQGRGDIVGYTNNINATLPDDEYVLFGDHTREVKYHNGVFAQGADGLKILQPLDKTRLLPRYLYFALGNADIPNLGYSRHWRVVKDLDLPIPPLSKQQYIVNILDKFSEYTTSLTNGLPAEIKLRKQQYEYYRNKLLTFKRKES